MVESEREQSSEVWIRRREIVGKKRSKISKMVLKIEMKTRERGKGVWESKDR